MIRKCSSWNIFEIWIKRLLADISMPGVTDVLSWYPQFQIFCICQKNRWLCRQKFLGNAKCFKRIKVHSLDTVTRHGIMLTIKIILLVFKSSKLYSENSRTFSNSEDIAEKKHGRYEVNGAPLMNSSGDSHSKTWLLWIRISNISPQKKFEIQLWQFYFGHLMANSNYQIPSFEIGAAYRINQ